MVANPLLEVRYLEKASNPGAVHCGWCSRPSHCKEHISDALRCSGSDPGFYLSMNPGHSPSSALLPRAKKHAITHHLHLEHKTPRMIEIAQKRRESQLDRSNRFFENRSRNVDFFLALSHGDIQMHRRDIVVRGTNG